MTTHWNVGDVAIWVEKGQDQRVYGMGSNNPAHTVKGLRTEMAVIIKGLIGPTGSEHSAEVEYLAALGAGPSVVSLASLECDPELTLKQASLWRDAGGRVKDTT